MLKLYLDRFKYLFYEQMDYQTSACLYGSATSGDWVPSRSDLDVLILIPKESLNLLGKQVRAWSWNDENPILDGYVVYSSGDSLEFLSLEQLAKVSYPSGTSVSLIDQWYIKNRSKLLFGEKSLDTLFPKVSIEQLRVSAFENLQALSQGIPRGGEATLSHLIWSCSWAARMLMLSRGHICESKRDALEWLANQNSEVSNLVDVLLKNFENPNRASVTVNSEHSLSLCKVCIELAQRELAAR